MPWFPVDDRFHSHPKAAAASLAAIGLWTVAGSWAREHLRDGDLPEHMIPSLSRGATELADELVTVGLWRRTKAGYRFHQWSADGDGSPRNSTRSEVVAAVAKKSSGGALGNHRRWHTARGVVDDACAYCQPERAPPNGRTTDRSTDGGSDRTPNPPRPDPSPTHGGGSAEGVPHAAPTAGDPPPRRCPKHTNDEDPPNCGPCKDARLAWEDHRNQRAKQRAQAAASAPRCPHHRGQPAGNCAPCRADQLAAGPTDREEPS